VDGNEEVEVAAGDLLLFPHDNRHLLGSDFMLSPAPVGSEAIEGLIEMRWGGDGEATRFICGPARWHCHARRLPSASPK
jgi:AraC family transcriptional regulator, alkane utilization regulator